MPEVLMVLCISSGVLLWMLGGTYWKPFRRVLWPLVAGGVLLVSGAVWWKALGVALGLGVVNALPYGDRTSWLVRGLVFATYSLPSLFLGWRGVVLGLPLTVSLLLFLMWLSRRINAVTWKLWEAEAGFLQAFSLIVAR